MRPPRARHVSSYVATQRAAHRRTIPIQKRDCLSWRHELASRALSACDAKRGASSGGSGTRCSRLIYITTFVDFPPDEAVPGCKSIDTTRDFFSLWSMGVLIQFWHWPRCSFPIMSSRSIARIHAYKEACMFMSLALQSDVFRALSDKAKLRVHAGAGSGVSSCTWPSSLTIL